VSDRLNKVMDELLGESGPDLRGTADDVSDEWRSFLVLTWSSAMNGWVDKQETVDVRPGESAKSIADEISREHGQAIMLDGRLGVGSVFGGKPVDFA